MHELSLAHGVVEVAVEAAQRLNALKVTAVNLRLGQLSGVEPDALLFCYEIAAHGTLLEGSRLVIIDVPLVVWCPHCLKEVPLAEVNRFRCPACGTAAGEIRRGRELEIESLELETA